ncbi:hypothetical protein Q4506_07915 [Colwellia sp. 4_MG-2023]|uniref:TcpQ domain-containing protein n=1 Tax=unclassified Colwellia TaxID=196834 RepID=UPI0026E205E6|nr:MULTISPECIES: TcpQ domain-containing protein [unclassified Colwellia]MDO6506779.1 hypothetical protein [Colwellia sp. 5_MG-2023]MDO6555605.1 hypothetical protein [Colwellia sp. 4_MG-2023]
MGFWIRSAIIAAILIGLAIAFFLNKDLLLSSNQDDAQSLTAEASDAIKKQLKSKRPNAAAEGLSNFYAKVYGDKEDRKIVNNVIFLPEPEGDLVKILQAKQISTRSYPRSWRGTEENRPFRKGETLYQKLSEYSSSEGLDIMWRLNKDFIIKHPFRIDNDIINTAKKIGNTISGHFPEGINSYFCYRQRTLVFVNESMEYLNDECLHLKN